MRRLFSSNSSIRLRVAPQFASRQLNWHLERNREEGIRIDTKTSKHANRVGEEISEHEPNVSILDSLPTDNNRLTGGSGAQRKILKLIGADFGSVINIELKLL